MRHALTIAVALLALALGPVAGAWEHNAVLWNPESSPIPVYLHNAGVDALTVEELEAVVEASFATWNEVPCASVALEYAGRTEMSVVTDDTQVLEWIEDSDRWFYGSMAAGANIAFVYDDPATPEHEDPQVDIAFNGVNFTWVVGGGDLRQMTTLDPQAVLTHELGHFLGLAHSRGSNAATMAPAYVPDTSQASLSFDDKAGMCEKYWVEASECEQDSDCPDGSACETWESTEHGASVKLCAEHHGVFGDPCSGADLNCESICLFSRPDFSEGTCSAHCETDDDCPCDWSCRNLQTADNPFLVCRDTPPDGGGHGCEPDIDAGDADAETDVGQPDASDDASVPDAQPDAVADGEFDTGAVAPPGAGGGGGCLCAATSPRTPAPLPLVLFSLLGVLVLWRRRTGDD